jgi:Uma2 family endonuclease
MSYAMEDWSRLHRITVDEYYRMAEVGLLAPDARVELIEGVIIDMVPIGELHAVIVDRLVRRFCEVSEEKAILRVQGPVRLSNYTEPEPDFALLKPRADEYRRGHPRGPDTMLAVEVSNTTLRFDLRTKLPLYARHGVEEVWVADVNRSGFHVCRRRTDVGYSDVQFVEDPGRLDISSLEGVSIDLTGLFQFD